MTKSTITDAIELKLLIYHWKDSRQYIVTLVSVYQILRILTRVKNINMKLWPQNPYDAHLVGNMNFKEFKVRFVFQ